MSRLDKKEHRYKGIPASTCDDIKRPGPCLPHRCYKSWAPLSVIWLSTTFLYSMAFSVALENRIKTLLLSQDSSGKNHKNPQSNNNPTQLSLLPPLPSQATGIHSGGKAFPTSFCAQFSLGSIGIPPDEYLPFLS